MSIKFNWGTGIFIFIIIFVVTMLGVVYLSFQQDNDLVDESYYPKAMEYQQEINSRDRALELSSLFNAEQVNDEVIVTYPIEFKEMNLEKGEIFFYRPSAQKFDLKEKMSPGPDLKQTFPLSLFHSGKYIVKYSWIMGGETYFDEKTIIISK